MWHGIWKSIAQFLGRKSFQNGILMALMEPVFTGPGLPSRGQTRNACVPRDSPYFSAIKLWVQRRARTEDGWDVQLVRWVVYSYADPSPSIGDRQATSDLFSCLDLRSFQFMRTSVEPLKSCDDLRVVIPFLAVPLCRSFGTYQL